MSGHCEHCDKSMCGHYGYYLLTEKRMHCGGENQNGPVATWLSGHCPACAERERIVAWLRGAAIYDAADFIARGAHLEGQ